MRIGIGYDIHALVPDRALVLGGVSIPFEKGLLGHSDADVLCHAIADALLGAAVLGDIGEHFPDTDPKYKNCSSLKLLNQVNEMVKEAGYIIINIDSVIIAEKPKLSSYRKSIISKVQKALLLDSGAVSIKATTHEGLGPVGQEEAIAAYAVALLEKKG